MKPQQRNADALVGRFQGWLLLLVFVVTAATFIGIGMRTTSLVENSVLEQARSYTDLIIAARSWNSDFGGVYVTKTGDVVANPYLVELGIHADDELSDGTPVTLHNPEAMIREIGDKLPFSANGSDFKLTSLDPVNPNNEPDEWEREGLEEFETGVDERWLVAQREDGSEVYRYMRPLFVEDSCRACHAYSGYEASDVSGAMSIVLPYAEVTRALQQNRIQLVIVALAVLLGMWAIVLGLAGWLKRRLRSAQERLEHMATTDELTGLWNRRYALQSLSRELDRARREGSSVGVAMVDIDHFKQINDEFGHAAGDEALKRTTRALVQAVRPYDVVGRVGGEEMLIVASDVDAEKLAALAERVRETVDEIDLSDVCPDCHLTVSIGTALSSADADESDDALMARADAAMYSAKDAGRNRVVNG